ncbi:hypothetical protein [uncultured Stenotrophomonas sp.]|uniref:hypothetical protein n=1 Tax=uncultured Stenotrophomonas sp. TaxID=165438 RepID=UPI0025F88EE3|nr:hypothetical protein [uncultured Stenotrophomonas sp.]
MKAILFAATLSLALVSTAYAQSFPAELTQLGVVAGMPYAKAKRLLDAAGWRAKLAQGAPESLEGFPEVGCQKGGKQCATTFEKDDQQVAVRLGTTLAGQPFVQSAD